MKDVVKKLKIKEHSDRLEKLEVLAQLLKKQRKKFKLTLTKASEGICSVSYLSKIENNMLENVEDKYMLKLCERMKINYNDLRKLDDSYSLEEVAFNYLRGNYQSINELYYSRCDLFNNVKSDIINGYYYLINEKYEEIQEVIGTIHQVSSTLTATEYFMYIILVQEYYIKTFRIKEALDTFKELYTIGCRFKYIDWLIDYQGLRIYFHKNDYMEFLKFYHKIVYLEDLAYPNEIQKIARLMKISIEIKAGYTYILDSAFFELTRSNEHYTDEIMYYKTMILINMHRYEKVKEYITENNLSGDKYIALYNYACFMTNGFAITEYTNGYSNYHQIFNKFLSEYYLVKESKIDEKDALLVLKEFREYEEEYNHHIYNSVIFNNIADIYTSSTCYKDAMNYLKRKVSRII